MNGRWPHDRASNALKTLFDFDLSHRFHRALARTVGNPLPMAEAFRSPARGADVEAASLGRATLGRML